MDCNVPKGIPVLGDRIAEKLTPLFDSPLKGRLDLVVFEDFSPFLIPNP
ncbi:hypothetical protein JXQ31_02795 [candidate division KSB1 bacterium]|nr:hypothetical protein [candidate division KSB1 bacterium]